MGRGNGSEAVDEALSRRGTATATVDNRLLRRMAALSKERLPGRPMSAYERARYGHAVGHATGVRPGETLTIEIGDPEDAELAAEVAINAYLRGARKVRILTGADKAAAAERELATALSQLGPDEIDAEAIVVADAAAEGPWAEHVGERAAHVQINFHDPSSRAEVWNHTDVNELRWSLVYWPSSRMAENAMLDRDLDVSKRMLAEDLLYYSRSGEQDDPGSWERHIDTLRGRAQRLNELEIESLEIESDSGTSLQVGLLDTSMFNICDWETADGKRFGSNLPTEEVFVTPDPTQVNGRFTSVAPCIIPLGNGNGAWAAAVGGVFANGELQRDGFWVEPEDASADADEISARAYEYFRANPGALSVGELALVGSDSRIAGRVRETGRFYGLNNLDENAGVHFALGDSYVAGLTQMKDDSRRNRSAMHQDFTVSHGTACVRAKLRDGTTIDVMVDGEWQL